MKAYLSLSSFVILLCLVFLVVENGTTAEDTKLPTLSQLKLEFDIQRAELMTPIKELDIIYEGQLDRLLDKVTGAGNLPQALAVKAELETFGREVGDSEDEPFADLQRLRGIYAKVLTQKTEVMNGKLLPLSTNYHAQLEELMKLLTQEVKLDDAVKVQTELESLKKLIASVKESDIPVIGARTQFRVGSPSVALTTEEGGAALAKVKVSGAQWAELQVETVSFSDAAYKWTKVPESLESVKFSLLGKHAGVLEFSVEKDGLIFLAVSTRFSTSPGQGDGWEKDALDVKGLRRKGWRHLREFDDLSIEDSGALMVFYKECVVGETYSIRTEKYIAPFLLTR